MATTTTAQHDETTETLKTALYYLMLAEAELNVLDDEEQGAYDLYCTVCEPLHKLVLKLSCALDDSVVQAVQDKVMVKLG